MTFTQHVWQCQGLPGGPGYFTFRARGQLGDTAANAWTASIKNMLGTWTAILPTGCSLVPDNFVKFIGETDGAIVGVQSLSTVPATVTPAGAGSYATYAGGCIVWRTGVPSGRRLIIGRTFVVPLVSSCWGSNGAFTTSTKNTLINNAVTYISTAAPGADGHPVIWSRPTPAHVGRIADVLTVTVNQYGCDLTSRHP